MVFFRYLKGRQGPVVLGYLCFIGMMATGYYYNITFVQLGLVDLGTRLIGMSQHQVSLYMAYFALITCVVALTFGLIMMRRGWSQQFFTKIRLAFAVVLVQTALTGVAPFIRSEIGFPAWITVASCTMGVGVPATFSLTVDLIPARDRGYVAAFITAAAYFVAPIAFSRWEIELFAAQLLWIMVPGVLVFGVFAFKRFDFMEKLARQHTRPEFRYGRFVRRDRAGHTWISYRLVGLIVLMFGVYFVDSLGFLRLIETPVYMDTAWHSPDSYSPLSMPILYSVAVSLYTVVNFAIWADVSTPETISRNTAIGVALSGWTATFLSTALAIYWEGI